MASSKGNIASRVEKLIRPTVEEMGYTIWDIEYVKEGADWHLRITIDSPNGIDINDCEKVHRAIDPVLDEADPIEDAYYLDVSSPGLEREVRTAEHYLACVGIKLEVKLFTAFEGMKGFVATLSDYDKEKDAANFVLENGKTVVLERKSISKCNVYFDFANDKLMKETE